MAGPIGRKFESIGRKIEEKINNVICDDKFEASLERILPRPSGDGVPIQKRLREAQFRQLAEFCIRTGRPQWGYRPRTYAVLRMIGCPEVIERFIDERLTDISLPYSEDNLPSFLTGQARMLFLDCQNFVLNGRAAALERSGEPHQNVQGSADDYFDYIEDLGAGTFGEVDSVMGQMSLKKFARKRIKRYRLFSKDKASLQAFENELQTLKSLSHRHLVQLVGSYTDSSCVGLIMTPVADMNLATYLKCTMNPESRKICLRRFFGCLAAALSYLHAKRVQHKDIKPENILVKQKYVYLTDFGTSRSWDHDASRSTRGTAAVFTPRYCAPEVVQFGSSRNESRDIWSLGCVFFEMCSILADHSVEDMRDFLRKTGTRGEYIRENIAGVNAWTEKLKSEFSILHDQRPLELALRMCTTEPQKRPVAKEVHSLILDFDGPARYYGLCCDEQSDLKDHLSNQIMQTDEAYESYGLVIESSRSEGSQEACPALFPEAKYRIPTVEDPTQNTTLQAFIPPGGIAETHILEDAEYPGASLEVVKPCTEQTNPTPQSSLSISSKPGLARPLQELEPPALSSTPSVLNQVPNPSYDNLSRRIAILDLIKKLDFSQLPCPWPKCSQKSRFDNCMSLGNHLRDCHGTHELFWTPLLISSPPLTTRVPSSLWTPGQIISESITSSYPDEAKAFVLKRSHAPHQALSDPFSDQLRCRASETKERLRQVEYDPSHPGRKNETARKTHQSVHFGLLPEDRRPESLRSESKAVELKAQEEPVISPDPLPEPSISYHTRPGSRPATTVIPKSSLAPSYFLATTNRFSQRQIKSILAIKKSIPMLPPLFVYGSLMFPSVLRAQAEKSISAEGIYSRALQRRIQTSSEDWSNINTSLRHAAQQMTPALLKGYLRFEIERFGDAALMPCHDGEASETKGFLVSGLSHEALVCLDYLLTPEGYYCRRPKSPATATARSDPNYASYVDSDSDSDSFSDSFSESDNDGDKLHANKLFWPGKVRFQSKRVMVTISDSNGNPQEIEALAYVWHPGPGQKLNAWDANEFIKCKTFSDLSTSMKNDNNKGYDWVAEEGILASEMGMLYAMPGDELCDRIVNDDVEKVVSLVTNGLNVDAPCHHYGTPLQAAAAKGHEKLVYVMLKFWGANANKQGGRYNSPLVAAISNGHDDVVRTLLKHGANPIAGAGSFISPIYQAVSFEDVEMTHMLLEGGGWLCKDYIELLDLAEETGNHELCDLLQDYDIRNLHRRNRIREKLERRPQRSVDKKASKRSGELGLRDLMATVVEVWRLKGQKGKWTGTKAIKILRLIYGDDIPEHLLSVLGQNLQVMHIILKNLSEKNVATRKIQEAKDRSSIRYITHDYNVDDKAIPNLTEVSLRYSRPSPHGASRIAQQESRDIKTAVEEVFCLTCNGRGGRKGTGRLCEKCRGTGRGSERSKKTIANKESQSGSRCQACNGTGNVFSERDRCRACNAGSGRNGKHKVRRLDHESKTNNRHGTVNDDMREQRGRYLDPPPPYPGGR